MVYIKITNKNQTTMNFKNMNYLTKLLTISLFFISQLSEAQSPWTREKGKAYLQLGASGLFYDVAQIDGKKVELQTNFTDVTTQIYTEYGLTNRLEAQLILPYKFINAKDKITQVSQSLSGLGNLTLGLKYKLMDKNWKWSAGLQYTANTTTRAAIGANFLTTGYEANTLIPYTTIGTSKGKWYYFANLGYGYMSNNFSDYLKFDAELGYKITPKSHLILALNTKNAVVNEKAFDNNTNFWPSYLDRQTYDAFGLKYNYEFKPEKMGVNLAFYGAFGNNNAPYVPSSNLGVYFKI
ncbi:MAG: hypothetical protein QG594_1533 [Bacteroidota bacterium]|nr:hypothetical protein [Bacteroidota bacterium]